MRLIDRSIASPRGRKSVPSTCHRCRLLFFEFTQYIARSVVYIAYEVCIDWDRW